MHYQGKDLVSQATQRSHRNLVATAGGITLAKWYHVPLANLTVLGVKVPAAAVGSGVIVIIFALAMTHLIHWYGDYRSAQAWNSGEKNTAGARWDDTGSPLITPLEQALKEVKQLTSHIDTIAKGDGAPLMGELQSDLAVAQQRLNGVRRSALSWKRYADIYFVGWYLLVPIILAIVALGLPPENLAATNPPTLPRSPIGG